MTDASHPGGPTPGARRAILVAALLAACFFAATVVAPLLNSALLHAVYTPLCHQKPERSLSVAQGGQAVCARCSGLYLGGAAGLLLGALWFPRRRLRPRPVWLAVAVAPSLVDLALPWIGVPGLPNGPRWLLALPAGFVAALFLADGIADLHALLNRTGPRDEARAVEETHG